MAGFHTQFHATLDELCEFIEAWLDQYPLVISAFAFPPATRVAISRATLREVLARPDVDQVTFTHGPVDPSLTSASAVADTGESFLYLLMGRLKPLGLEQSMLSSGYDDPIWNKISKDLKRRTTAGADFVANVTGEVYHFVRDARFTPGAKALSASGTPLREQGGKRARFLPK